MNAKSIKGACLCMLIAILSLQASLAAQEARDELQKATEAAAQGNSEVAVKHASNAIAKDAELAIAYYLRGREYFRLGMIDKSIIDFDKYVELAPQIESRQWERGIAYYYAREFDKGARQFELYQTYHDNDVENSVWRFLCMTPSTGVDRARAVMLPIKDDRRIPMMAIFEMYRGNLQPEDVLRIAREGDPPDEVLTGRLFYAHLYIGLYYEVLGNSELAKKYVDLAAAPDLADNPRLNRYMWDVARIHAMLLKKKGDDKTKPKTN